MSQFQQIASVHLQGHVKPLSERPPLFEAPQTRVPASGEFGHPSSLKPCQGSTLFDAFSRAFHVASIRGSAAAAVSGRSGGD